jgi:hypothetical protein
MAVAKPIVRSKTCSWPATEPASGVPLENITALASWSPGNSAEGRKFCGRYTHSPFFPFASPRLHPRFLGAMGRSRVCSCAAIQSAQASARPVRRRALIVSAGAVKNTPRHPSGLRTVPAYSGKWHRAKVRQPLKISFVVKGYWCGREDSNFHGLSPTTTSTLRVYQFRHDR